MRILVIAPHADDECLGAGGVMSRYVTEGHHVAVAVLTGPGEGEHPVFPRAAWDTVRSECREAIELLGVQELLFENIPAALITEYPLHQLNATVDKIVRDVQAELLFLPFLYDLHRDHREIFHAFSVAWRPHTRHGRNLREIYCYETQSETHSNFPYVEAGFLPNCWFDISGEPLTKKLAALRCYQSQMQPAPHSRSLTAIEALATWRGSQMNVAAAEAFVLVRKLS